MDNLKRDTKNIDEMHNLGLLPYKKAYFIC